ncbi:hypothetical protein [Streptomyces coeruleorubidus]
MEMFLEAYGTLAEADRQLRRATAHGWHLYFVPLPRPADDYRKYDVEASYRTASRAAMAGDRFGSSSCRNVFQ